MAILKAIQNPFSVLVGENLSAHAWWEEVPAPVNCLSLSRLLLARGGDRVQFYPEEFTDEFCSTALATMSFQLFSSIEDLPTTGTNNCHGNTAKFVIDNLSDDDIQACTGWAFSDEVWRRHSWVLEVKNSVIRDDIKRDIYFGGFLSAKACLEILRG